MFVENGEGTSLFHPPLSTKCVSEQAERVYLVLGIPGVTACCLEFGRRFTGAGGHILVESLWGRIHIVALVFGGTQFSRNEKSILHGGSGRKKDLFYQDGNRVSSRCLV